jgi:fumarate reductase subunit D
MGKIFLLGVITLFLWHAAHRLRVTVHDFGVRADGLVAIVVYSLAGIGTLLTLVYLLRI